MLRALTSFLFGTEEKSPKDVYLSEVVEGDWLLVNPQEILNDLDGETALASRMDDTSASSQSNPSINEEVEANLEVTRRERSMMSEPALEVGSIPSLSVPGAVSQAKALAKVTHVARLQMAQARADRHILSSGYIHRQNCVRQRDQRHSSRKQKTYLHQPGHRN